MPYTPVSVDESNARKAYILKTFKILNLYCNINSENSFAEGQSSEHYSYLVLEYGKLN
jgi:hypothetical protein